jgi:endonuclease/exonuclease/phosphatase family metal-dependent hydrolase
MKRFSWGHGVAATKHGGGEEGKPVSPAANGSATKRNRKCCVGLDSAAESPALHPAAMPLLLRRIPLRLLLPVVALVLVAGAARAAAAEPLRVMTYNIQHGEGIDKKIDLARIANAIIAAQADIVALEEVDRGVKRTAGVDEPAELARLTGMTAYFDNNFHYQGGEYGNAVLTRFPIRRAKNTHYRMLRPNEQRGVIQLVLEVGGRDVLFMTTHIDYRADDSERLINIDELKQIVADATAAKLPVILCGDFNAIPGSRTHAKVKTFLTDTWEIVGHGNGFSYSTEKPVKRIDYVWISPASIEPVKIEVLKSDASDHLPVLAELRLR